MTPAKESLTEWHRAAVALARLAGAEIQNALGRELAIRYKGLETIEEAEHYRDPASEADEHIEQLIRDRLAQHFPAHGVIGEEMATVGGEPGAPVWVIDPIDGTANFVNGLPLFAASIGIMHHGRAVVGALWCSTSHTLRSGVYHACEGGCLHFDESPVELRAHADLRRYLAGEPDPTVGRELNWEVRKTGSAALECAFVAAGLLRVARFESANLWDVAGGLALLEAAGREVHERVGDEWRPLAAVADDEIIHWRRTLMLGESDAIARLIAARGSMNTPP